MGVDRSGNWIVPLEEVGPEDLARAGGKSVNLGVMTRAGLPVPGGFCLAVAAYRRFLEAAGVESDLEELEALEAGDLEAVRRIGGRLRAALEATLVPEEIRAELVAAWRERGELGSYAVRSSATAEDLPGASFAGQHDTFLEVRGEEELVARVRACWASLFTDRAITYRARAGFSHREVGLSVLVQRQVDAQVSGVLFTADPLRGHRHMAVVDACAGLGEALVSGRVEPDHFRVDRRSREVLERRIAETGRAHPLLDDAELLALVELGERAEALFGGPQDLEWCLADDRLLLVQSRPVTTLFPLPQPREEGLRLYLSAGHLQVMTDPMKPFGHSMIRRIIPVDRGSDGEARFLRSAGGRLYADVTGVLRSRLVGWHVMDVLRFLDRTMAAAVEAVRRRPEFRRGGASVGWLPLIAGTFFLGTVMAPRILCHLMLVRLETIRSWTRDWMDRQYAESRLRVEAEATPMERLGRAVAILSGLIQRIVPWIPPSILGGILARLLLRFTMGRRADPEDLEALERGLEGNVTTEMNLRIGDLADAARGDGEDFEAQLATFLEEFGMRGGSEIDVTRPRWRDDPRALHQVIQGALAGSEPGAHRAHHERLQREGRAAGDRIAAAAPWGTRWLVRRWTRAVRYLFALREHPKFQVVRHLGLVREAALEVGAELVEAGTLERVEDVWFLDFGELLRAVEGELPGPRELVDRRRGEHAAHASLRPPRVMTSDGEIVIGRPRLEGAPEGALVGTPASAGVIEGPARVVRDPATERVEVGEVLIAPFTDPGWTPLFLNASALVMEVGGLMTHGSVVAREYGIPAVVGVEEATRRIETGQRVRVDGARGVVEVLSRE